MMFIFFSRFSSMINKKKISLKFVFEITRDILEFFSKIRHHSKVLCRKKFVNFSFMVFEVKSHCTVYLMALPASVDTVKDKDNIRLYIIFYEHLFKCMAPFSFKYSSHFFKGCFTESSPFSLAFRDISQGLSRNMRYSPIFGE